MPFSSKIVTNSPMKCSSSRPGSTSFGRQLISDAYDHTFKSGVRNPPPSMFRHYCAALIADDDKSIVSARESRSDYALGTIVFLS